MLFEATDLHTQNCEQKSLETYLFWSDLPALCYT
jgi:hypothetical protein